eukprot:181889-Hanusia_phi.AAC.1
MLSERLATRACDRQRKAGRRILPDRVMASAISTASLSLHASLSPGVSASPPRRTAASASSAKAQGGPAGPGPGP